MALGTDGAAPYAPARTIIGLIDQYRDKGLPTPITKTTLERAGVEPSLSSRTLQALKLLDLVDEGGEPTSTMKSIELATTSDLPSVVAGWVQAAYREIFAFVDPGDDVQRISDQFRHYGPKGMRPRMVTLFLGLCAYAKLIPELPKMPRASKPAGNGKPISIKKPKVTTDGAVVKEKKDDEKPKVEVDPSFAMSDAEMKALYFNLLLAKAKESDGTNVELLDRIEKLIGPP